MSLVIVKCVNNLIMNIFLFLNVRYNTNSKIKLNSFHTLIWLFFSIIPCLFLYKIGYNFIFNILSFIVTTIFLEKVFKFSFSVGMVFTLYFMLISILPDLISSAIAVNFFKYKLINPLFTIFTNLVISILTYYLSKIKLISEFTKSTVKHVGDDQYRNIIVYVLLAALAIGLSYYVVIGIYVPSKFYFATNIIILIFVILTFIYINKIIKYSQLKTKNSMLYDCMSNIENYQEEQDLKIHEYKNQLSKITSITTDKEVIRRIEEILDVDLNADTYLLGKIKNIPKGELKSLIYYKLLIASRENLKLFINISSEITKKNYNFSKKQYKSLSHLIGIFFDNAIDASKESKEKELFFEIYDSNVGLTFLISNTYRNNVDLESIGVKGYTTKGKNHGKGLHLAGKIVNNSTDLYTRTIVDSNHFTQKIIIKKE